MKTLSITFAENLHPFVYEKFSIVFDYRHSPPTLSLAAPLTTSKSLLSCLLCTQPQFAIYTDRHTYFSSCVHRFFALHHLHLHTHSHLLCSTAVSSGCTKNHHLVRLPFQSSGAFNCSMMLPFDLQSPTCRLIEFDQHILFCSALLFSFVSFFDYRPATNFDHT